MMDKSDKAQMDAFLFSDNPQDRLLGRLIATGVGTTLDEWILAEVRSGVNSGYLMQAMVWLASSYIHHLMPLTIKEDHQLAKLELMKMFAEYLTDDHDDAEVPNMQVLGPTAEPRPEEPNRVLPQEPTPADPSANAEGRSGTADHVPTD